MQHFLTGSNSDQQVNDDSQPAIIAAAAVPSGVLLLGALAAACKKWFPLFKRKVSKTFVEGATAVGRT